VRPIIRHHHERLDGSGYPDGLRGDQIPLLAQLVAIVDVYDALTSDRPYRRALAHCDAVRELQAGVSAGQYNQQFVEAFLDIMRQPYPSIPQAERLSA
jgi:putative two-component system response regulator